jgi:hypothetical protein
VNIPVNRLFFLFLLNFSLYSTLVKGNIFLDAAQDRISKISSKPVAHKHPLEFKQAVTRYIKNTENQCLHGSQRYADENISYKRELQYLFNNYGKFSTAALLSRLRSAHQAMVKHESCADSDVYKKYEHISSALLLICSQVFFNDARDQILGALHEIDNLIAYWRYQYNHQLSYFFSKSPIKWVVGKEQDKEIAYNLNRLERKQRELYILLGSLTGHIHIFTESGTTYNDCYAWIEELFVVLTCIKTLPHYNGDGTQFDKIAAELESKIKLVGKLKDDCLSSISFASKSNHFVRNWVAYTALLAAAGYAVHCNTQNPDLFPAAFAGVQDTAKYLLVLLIDPLKKIYKRMETAFSSKADGDVKSQIIANKDNKMVVTAEVELEPLFEEIVQVAEEVVSDISDELAVSKDTARERLFAKLRGAIEVIKKPSDGYIYSSSYKFDEKQEQQFCALVDQISSKRVSPIMKNGEIINQHEVDAYQKAKIDLQTIIAGLSKQTPMTSSEGWSVCGKLNIFDILFDVLDDFAEPLKRYTDIIDQKVLKLIRLISVMAVTLGRRGDILAKEADIKLKAADATLQDNELTFMFTALIPLITMCAGITKGYQWITKKNYAPIRIALTDINSLLIESVTQLDDHDYGKLVYLIGKLRHKAKLLKHSLSTEFLVDVAKLESKRYSAQTKRDIVENMFNKYVFLGRIAV